MLSGDTPAAVVFLSSFIVVLWCLGQAARTRVSCTAGGAASSVGPLGMYRVCAGARAIPDGGCPVRPLSGVARGWVAVEESELGAALDTSGRLRGGERPVTGGTRAGPGCGGGGCHDRHCSPAQDPPRLFSPIGSVLFPFNRFGTYLVSLQSSRLGWLVRARPAATGWGPAPRGLPRIGAGSRAATCTPDVCRPAAAASVLVRGPERQEVRQEASRAQQLVVSQGLGRSDAAVPASGGDGMCSSAYCVRLDRTRAFP